MKINPNEVLKTAGTVGPVHTFPRPLYEVAAEIRKDWSATKGGVYFGAVPYLDAMDSLNKITDQYGCDPADMIVRYFLANANTWRGVVAKRVKLELKKMLLK